MNADAEPLPNPQDLPDIQLPLVRPRAAAPRHGVRALVTKWFFGWSAAAAALGAISLALAPPGLAESRVAWPAASFAALAVLALLLMAVPRRHIEHAMAMLFALATLVIAGSALQLGDGLAWPGLAFYGVFVCLLCVAASARHGVAVALLAALCVIGVDSASRWAGLPVAPDAAQPLRLTLLLLLVGTGLAGGLVVARVSERYVRAADEREQRFRGLLRIAADAYWEIDHEYRLRELANQRDPARALSAAEGLGQVPWDLPEFRCDAETLDGLLADLDSRAPFRDLPVQWRRRSGRWRSLRISGEPRLDERGVFLGYWGVASDVTADVEAREALWATETRYQELFSRIPSPLVLHRDGRVLDANPAGVALFGHREISQAIGTELLSAYESGDSRERERRRCEELEAMPPGEGVPVADFRLVVGGRRLSVRATAVRVDAQGGPATLAIYLDDTERRAAEEAVRRSEAMLSHLVATSPDMITLTEMASGRYAMVNRTFERVSGYTAAEVVGRTGLDIDLWARHEERAQFVAAVRERGRVLDMPLTLKAKDGRLIQTLGSGARFAMDRREYLVINARDVTEVERSRLEREAILAHASIGIAVTRERRFVLVNPSFEQMFGWPAGELVGQSGRAVWASEDDYQRLGAALGHQLGAGESAEFEATARRRDGSTFLARYVAKAIDPSHPAHGGTVWIVEDITQRHEFEQALARARDEAEAASRAKSAFLANTSHELRTPLNGMIGLAQLASAADLDEERRREYLRQIVDSAQSLAGIISDILDLSKIEAGKLHLETAVFDLGELLRNLQRSYATLAAARGLRLELDIGPGLDVAVTGDALRVRQILSNFLSNALKFTAIGEVRLGAARKQGERVRFEVRDSGPGIDALTQERLFQPFTQADESMTRRFGGTGLGLSICRELAQLMGGTVGVVSEPGMGSVFWAELPLPIASTPPPAPHAFDPSSPGLRGFRVLLVEDNPVNMLIAAALLERWGVQVTQVTDGRQAVEAVQRTGAEGQPFDAVLMDVQMPVLSGYEATRELRRLPAGQRLPIIALTAAALVTEREEAIEAGMDDFLTKPIDADRLRDTLQRWLLRTVRG